MWPDSSPATHQTLGQQGGTGEDSHTHLADWTLSVAAIEKKKEIEQSIQSLQLDISAYF